MRSTVTAALAVALAAGSLHAQALSPRTLGAETEDYRMPAVGYRLVRSQLEPSYITVMGGIGNLPSLLFEANVAPHFTFGWDAVTVVATAKIVLRMLNDSTGSAPIRSPSYMPQVTMYLRGAADSNHANFWSITLSHHSNGQAGEFYNAQFQPNTLDGSFSTNYLEVAFQRAYKRAGSGVGWVRLAARQYLPIIEDSALRIANGNDQYGRQRVLLSGMSRRVLPIVPLDMPVDFAVQWEAFYILDRVFQGYDFLDGHRAGASFTINVNINSSAMFGLFLNGYIGQDYYNIFYKDQIKALRFGLELQSVTSFQSPQSQ